MSEEKKCASCGAKLDSDAPEGLCARCLLAINLGKPTEVPENPSHGQKPPDPPSPQEIGKLFPHLEVLEFIGNGGMGVVYKARQPRLNRLVALKILAPHLGSDPQFAERFEREAQTLARLSHQNIVTLYDFGESNGHYYLLMEFVDGVNLREMLRTSRLKPEEALSIVPKICDALQYAHGQGVIHRDIKPENILIDHLGRLKITDFGIAKILAPTTPAPSSPQGQRAASAGLTEQGHMLGTPHYMAPEQLEHPQLVDHRADIYSLGVVFYEMLTGELPIGKFQPPSQKVQVDVRLDTVVLRTLEKEPERRYQQASEVKTGVETVAHSAGSAPRTVVMPPKAGRNWWLYGTAAVTACLLVFAAMFLFLWKSGAGPRADAFQLSQEGWRLWQSGQSSKAVEKFEQALKIDPENANTWNGLGWANFASGKYAEADKAFQHAVSVEPMHPAALNGLGQVQLAQKNYAEAEQYLVKAAPRASAAAFGLARLYLLQGKYDQAEKYAQQVIDSGEGNEMIETILRAAKEKRLNDTLRQTLEPR